MWLIILGLAALLLSLLAREVPGLLGPESTARLDLVFPLAAVMCGIGVVLIVVRRMMR